MNKLQGAIAFSLLLTSGAALADAGDIVISAGAVNIDNKRSSSTPQHTTLAPSIATRTGLVPGSFDSPGTEQTIGNAIKPILTMSYFITENWAVTVVGGIPPKLNVYGHGSVVTPGLLNKVVPPVEMGKASNNPVATVLHWFPSALVQYYFGERGDNFHPFVGVGLGYSFFTHVRLEPGFKANLNKTGSFLTLASTLDPTDSSDADASAAFRPLLNAGFAYQFDKTWGMGVSLSYVPIKTVATIRVKDKYGKVAMTSTADLDIPTVATSATVAYKF